MVVYNSLGWKREDVIRIPVSAFIFLNADLLLVPTSLKRHHVNTLLSCKHHVKMFNLCKQEETLRKHFLTSNKHVMLVHAHTKTQNPYKCLCCRQASFPLSR